MGVGVGVGVQVGESVGVGVSVDVEVMVGVLVAVGVGCRGWPGRAQSSLPESVKVLPTTGINSQEYLPSSRVSLSTPNEVLSRTSLFAIGSPNGLPVFTPPVPEIISRMPYP